MYTCKYCGKEFDNRYKLTGHSTHCKENPNYEHNKENCNNFKKYNYNNNYNKENLKCRKDLIPQDCYCQYCNKHCHNLNSLRNHERLCKNNPNKAVSGFINYNNEIHLGLRKGTNNYIKAKQLGLPKPQLSAEAKYKIGSTWRGKKFSTEYKRKISEGTIKYIEQTKGQCKPRYSIKGCRYIDKLNEEKHWNLQHAENGGEKRIGCYFLDGYDKDLNIVFEYDEPKHYKDIQNNILQDKDIERQTYIIEQLHCEFWRYNEAMDLLYQVN